MCYNALISTAELYFDSSFQGYPTWTHLSHMVRWPDGHKWPLWPYMAIHGHLAIGPCATNMAKWGIPEKSYENVAQQCELDGCSAILTGFMAEKHFFAIFFAISSL